MKGCITKLLIPVMRCNRWSLIFLHLSKYWPLIWKLYSLNNLRRIALTIWNIQKEIIGIIWPVLMLLLTKDRVLSKVSLDLLKYPAFPKMALLLGKKQERAWTLRHPPEHSEGSQTQLRFRWSNTTSILWKIIWSLSQKDIRLTWTQGLRWKTMKTFCQQRR